MKDFDCCLSKKIYPENLNIDNLDKIVRFAEAFKDPIRIKIVKLLKQQSKLCNCDLQRILGLTQSKVSYHIKVLTDGGIIKVLNNGKWNYYELVNRDILQEVTILIDKLQQLNNI